MYLLITCKSEKRFLIFLRQEEDLYLSFLLDVRGKISYHISF